MKKHLYSILIVAVTIILDLVTKNLVVEKLQTGSIEFLNSFVRIALVYNEGGVFGILQGYKNMFLAVSIAVLGLMIFYYIYEKNKSVLFNASMSLIVSGAVGNIIDRLMPGRPGVVDFISIGVDGVYRWPSFNVADSAIVVGALMLVVVFYLEEKKNRAAKSGS